ncbi:MAG TPA: DUF5320 domain-containing protein [Candidatus Methanoculleus thermohydrogenotrophicum]|nr:DUF5320 domain-containing protein [Candidatus Methanoculleus thermohydrogenotrophicum]NLM82025.1 DUF5320 domain-containing protein [Candidatus Methanoculleus thermohydrogenotrophicum]HOB17284.1 DUF5320 domain-containing protein [Candidatus Methanoculleus thermohydrogenotrophicum]HPZ37431.1 DUF5320 domain-containing protein [Candidatus Methanoculleus thermohydrogenotrophicum]HQC90892.1 DUF5320 domain-containing protein [Candidatus Methanoculleus thermohydrogenotrophicum]
MPGFDGTGPMGQGPMTGGRFGYCHPATRRRWPPMWGCRIPYSPHPGPVYGLGRGGMPRGGGRGRGWRCW